MHPHHQPSIVSTMASSRIVMGKTYLGLLIAIGAAFAASSPALAQQEQFSGPHVEAIVGWNSGDRSADPRSSKRDDGLLYGGSAGYDLRLGNIVVGALGEISDSTGSSCAQLDRAAGPAGSGIEAVAGHYCRHESRTLFGGLRLGYVAGDRSLLYVSGGYVNARQAGSFDGTIAGEPVKASGHNSQDGIRLGGGVERALADHVFIKAEYRYTATGSHLRNDQHQLVTGFGYRF
jgi:outer membrane immunogenic protein